MLPIILGTIVILVSLIYWLSLEEHPQIKGLLGYPVFGIISKIAQHKRNGTIHLFLQQFADKPISKFRPFLGATVFTIADPAVAKQILTDSAHFGRGIVFQNAAIDIMPMALFLIPSGEMWKQHRKLLQPGFGPVHLKHALEVSSQCTLGWLSHVKPSGRVNIHAAANALALDILGRVAFGHDFQAVKAFLHH
ncbi:cytochrome P450 [Gorgonomyces haynaldii]|nr:cytochrome P450 [Gorgonomyces haynaldii]